MVKTIEDVKRTMEEDGIDWHDYSRKELEGMLENGYLEV